MVQQRAVSRVQRSPRIAPRPLCESAAMSQVQQEEELEEPWGLLVSAVLSPGAEEERVPLLGNTFTIGRDKGAELVLDGNRFVSTRHCLLQRDEEGRKWLTDSSTNGTLLNNRKLQKDNKVKLADGDIISVVFRKDMSECNVVYKFQDLSPSLDSPQAGGGGGAGEDDATLDLTQEIDYTAAEEVVDEAVSIREGKREARSDDAPSAKRPALVADSEHRESSEASPSPASEQGAAAKPGLVKTGSLEQTLICQICQELFHNCISLQPCMHCYCGGCYSEWMVNSNKCPACRCKVERISKNHLVNNLVDAFLRANPGRKRPEEDLKELDEKNKITKDMLYPKRNYYDDDGDDDSESYHSSSSPPSSPSLPPSTSSLFPLPGMQPTPGLFLGGPHLSGQRARFTCRQCPLSMGILHDPYHPNPPHNPSQPPPPPFTCSRTTNHMLCKCCLQPMPDRRTETSETIPPQKCDLCDQPYCNMYWGCRKPGCNGCLGQFKGMEFSDNALDRLINENTFESTILTDHLQSHHKTLKDLLTECCTKLDSGEFTCTDSRVSSNSHTCTRCALKNFKELAYSYRSQIPNNDFPASVTRRPNCHWGKNCRTQTHNSDHARRYNHICEQTRNS